MKTIQVNGKTDDLGALDLHLLTDIPKTHVDVIVTVYPASGVDQPTDAEEDWAVFIARFNGICSSAPLERGPQGDYEIREVMP